ncbi:unnamed protein product, partial [Choristocarpus tenellus]
VPYQRVVATQLLRVASNKASTAFRQLKHIDGKKCSMIKLHREKRKPNNKDVHFDLIKRVQSIVQEPGVIKSDLFLQYITFMGMRVESQKGPEIMARWSK